MENNDLLPIEGPGREDLRRLYSWTFEDAQKAQEEWRNRFGPDVVGRGPLFRWLGVQELKELYEIHKNGNRQALMEALFVCSLNSLPLPRWCEMTFLKAYRKVRQYRAKSWDEVFGQPHKKGTHLATKRQEREKSLLVYRRIKEIKENEPTTPIDEALFERVAKEFHFCGKTMIAEYYYSWKNRLNK